MPVRLHDRLENLTQRLEMLPGVRKLPPTTLQLLGQARQEQDWQQFLFYFLDPTAAHGFDHGPLKRILSGLAEQDRVDFSFSPFDLDDVHVATEVVTSNGRRPDAVIWVPDNWFICWELKVDAAEGTDQTADYLAADAFDSITVDKSDIPPDNLHYVYLAPNEAAQPTADAFVPITWVWVCQMLSEFRANTHGGYPARSTAQLEDFTSTIHQELTMTEYEENQQAKVELFLDHYDAITEIQQAFDSRWDEFTNTWGDRLVRESPAITAIDDSAVPDRFTAAHVQLPNGDDRLWTFAQSRADWGWLFPRNWWRRVEDGSPIFDSGADGARVGFLHRLNWHRESVVSDRKLIFYLRNAPASDDAFYTGFAERFNTDAEIDDNLPAHTRCPGRKSNVLESTYDLSSQSSENLFEAYTAALAEALDDHVISNPELMSAVDRIYDETVEQDCS